MRFLKEKAEILIISIFSIILGGIIVFTTLFPILSNIKGLRETTDSYQALANAEAGLEIELYNQKVDLLGGLVSGLNYITSTCQNNQINNSDSRRRERGQGHSTGRAHRCKHGDKIIFDLEVVTTTTFNIEYLKINSIGKYGDFERILFAGFRIGTTSP